MLDLWRMLQEWAVYFKQDQYQYVYVFVYQSNDNDNDKTRLQLVTSIFINRGILLYFKGAGLYCAHGLQTTLFVNLN